MEVRVKSNLIGSVHCSTVSTAQGISLTEINIYLEPRKREVRNAEKVVEEADLQVF